MCDSKDSINEFIIDNSVEQEKDHDIQINPNETLVISIIEKSNVFVRIKTSIARKIYWHTSVKDTCQYASFKDFKNSSWKPNKSLWSEIKSEWKSEWNLLKEGKLKPRSKFDIMERAKWNRNLEITEYNKRRVKYERYVHRYGGSKKS